MQVILSLEALQPVEDALCLVETGVVRHAVHDDKAVTVTHVLLARSRVLFLSRCVENVQHTSLQRKNKRND